MHDVISLKADIVCASWHHKKCVGKTLHCVKSDCLSSSTVKLCVSCIFILWLIILNLLNIGTKSVQPFRQWMWHLLCCLLRSNQGFTGQEQNLQESFMLIIINGNFTPLITGSGTPSTHRLGTRDSFLRGKMGGGDVKLTIHRHLAPRLEMAAALPLLCHTFSWGDVWLTGVGGGEWGWGTVFAFDIYVTREFLLNVISVVISIILIIHVHFSSGSLSTEDVFPLRKQKYTLKPISSSW